MLLTLRCSTRCPACREVTPVNAALPAVDCVSCGARVELGEALWAAVFQDLARRELGHADRGEERYQQSRSYLQVSFSTGDARCPHCEAAWEGVPAGACPSCELPIPVRERREGRLVAEDPGLAPEASELTCRACARPIRVGRERHAECEACSTQLVVPDAIWRRVNAPNAVAPWMVDLGLLPADPLEGVTVEELAVGPDGTLFLAGSTPNLEEALLAVDPASRSVKWVVDLGGLGGTPMLAPLPDGTVFVARNLGTQVWKVGPQGVLDRFEVGSTLAGLAAHPLGGALLQSWPHHHHERIGPDGRSLPPWPDPGFFGRLLGRGPAPAKVGRCGLGHDGELRQVEGHQLVRLSREGSVRWSVDLPGLHGTTLVPPCASRDGTSFVAYPVKEGEEGVVVRCSAAGRAEGPVFRDSSIRAIACAADGRLWIWAGTYGEGEGRTWRLVCLDPEGRLEGVSRG